MSTTTAEWTRIDAHPTVEWITAEIVLIRCCGEESTLYPDSDGGVTCPHCGKQYRLVVTAEVQVRDGR